LPPLAPSPPITPMSESLFYYCENRIYTCMYMYIVFHVAPSTVHIYHDSAPHYEAERLMRPASAEDYRLLLYNTHAITSSSQELTLHFLRRWTASIIQLRWQNAFFLSSTNRRVLMKSDTAMKPQTQHNFYSRIHFTKITVLRDSFKMLPESLHFWEIQNSIIT